MGAFSDPAEVNPGKLFLGETITLFLISFRLKPWISLGSDSNQSIFCGQIFIATVSNNKKTKYLKELQECFYIVKEHNRRPDTFFIAQFWI